MSCGFQVPVRLPRDFYTRHLLLYDLSQGFRAHLEACFPRPGTYAADAGNSAGGASALKSGISHLEKVLQPVLSKSVA